jgi:hypothetical protein
MLATACKKCANVAAKFSDEDGIPTANIFFFNYMHKIDFLNFNVSSS